MAGRVRHPIDLQALEAYITKNVPEIKVPLEVKQLTCPGGARYVLRKKPPGKLVSKTAHKVEREHRIIAALGATDVPVPRALCLCEDASVLGTPFYIMSFLDGRIIEDPAIPDASSPADRRAIWSEAVRTLAKLHRVDPATAGLASFGRPSGFYDRQISTWRTICEAQAATRDVDSDEPVGALPRFAEMMVFFSDKGLQPADRGTLIHGDYKIDNLVFHKTEPRVIGILDWEMSTIGHPLSDLANLMTPYYTAPLDPSKVHAHKGFLPGATPGLPSPDEVASLYFSVISSPSPSPSPSSSSSPFPSLLDSPPSSSPSLSTSSATPSSRNRELQWAQAFNIFRQAAICQGIAARQASRQASSEMARRYADARVPLAEFAWELIQAAGGDGGDSGSGKARL